MIAAAAAPAIVRAASLMPVRALVEGSTILEAAGHNLFTGDVGLYDGMRFSSSPVAAQVWSRALFEQLRSSQWTKLQRSDLLAMNSPPLQLNQLK